MSKLPDCVLKEFMLGNHVMRHKPGIWNGISSDQFIESTFMRYGHGPGGIIGITLQPGTLKRWALGLHICTQLKADVLTMAEEDKPRDVLRHKEEGSSRMQADNTDREKIKNKLLNCINPFAPESHPTGLVNIVTGRVSSDPVNVDSSVQLGQGLMQRYASGWPNSFHQPLSKPIVSMAFSKKQNTVDNVQVYDTSLIYSRVLGLQKVRDIDLKDVLSYELAAIPPSLFDEKSGEMRLSSSKSTLKSKLKVELTDRRSSPADAIVLDGCAVLWVVNWPNHGTVGDFVRNVVSYISHCLQTADTYLIFDRYYPHSTKEAVRINRAGKDASRRHQLSLDMPLPSQKICLSVQHNKVQLISLICKYLKDQHNQLPNNGPRFVITGPEPTPFELRAGEIYERTDLRTTHEEADVIIVQQVVHLAVNENKESIRIIADDTDVFVLLTYFYLMETLSCSMSMVSTSPGRTSVDIKATAAQHANIVQDLLPAHCLSGCDTVSCLFGIGKNTIVKILRSGKSLSKLGVINEEMSSVITQATKFMAACYGYPSEETMTDLRYTVWSKKMSNKKLTSAPDLKSLPPTTEAFNEHVYRAHFQAAVWRSSLDPDPPVLDPLHYGWSCSDGDNMVSPVALPPDVSPAPVEVLKLIKCGCSSSQPCLTSRCSCNSAQLSCSIFCACAGSAECRNQRTITSIRVHDDSDNEDEIAFS